MTYPNGMPRLPGQAGMPLVPAVQKTPVSCCGYTSLQGTPANWTCPGCGTMYPANTGGS